MTKIDKKTTNFSHFGGSNHYACINQHEQGIKSKPYG